MSGGGGKGGETQSSVQIDPRLQEGASQTLAAALESASIPYTPNRGITVAALSPAEMTAQNTAMSSPAGAFGLAVPDQAATRDYMPDPTGTNAMGITGYGTGAAYDEQIAASIPQSVQDERARIIAGYKDAAARTRGGGMPGMYGPMSQYGVGGGAMGGMRADPYTGETQYMQAPMYDEEGTVIGMTPIYNPNYNTDWMRS